MKLKAPLIQFRQPEPNSTPHHSKMGNLLPLNISINQRSANPEELGRGFDIYRVLKFGIAIGGVHTVTCVC